MPDVLFDHLVGGQQNRLWHGKAERLGGLGVQSHLEFDGQLNGKLRRLCASENAIHIVRRAAKDVRPIGSVGKQTAVSDVKAAMIDRRYVVSGCRQYG